MYEENRPFGVVKDNMVSEVESYTDELYQRGINYLETAPLAKDPEGMYDACMKARKLAEALIWKSAMRADLPDLSNNVVIRQRFVLYLEMVKDQVAEMVEQTDFGFLESMDIDEIKKEVANAYAEQDVAAIIFYICSYSLHMQMKRISGAD